MATVVLAQISDTATHRSAGSLVPLLALALLAALGVLVLVWQRSQKRGQALAATRAEVDKLTASVQELTKASAKQSEALTARQEEINALKRDLGAQKKKTHEAQEELRGLRQKSREQARLDVERRQSRPAFEPAPTSEKPAPIAETKPAPVVTPEPPAQDDGAARAEVDALTSRLEAIVAEKAALAERLASEKEAHRTTKREISRAKDIAEKLRRVDVISKSKLELLEDKLKVLGREHYETVSELAALKGEVSVPQPSTAE